MRSVAAIAMFLVASICTASQCPDPHQRQARIGGETINGGVVLHSKPLESAQVQLYFLTGKIAWTGMTDKGGNFHIAHLRPGKYRLDVRGWGSTIIQLDPKLTNLQLPPGEEWAYGVTLTDNECVDVGASAN